MTGPLLTARELADVLGVVPETVLRWKRRGDLPAVHLPGGAVRFRRDEFDAWLERRATGAPTGGAIRSIAPVSSGDEEV